MLIFRPVIHPFKANYLDMSCWQNRWNQTMKKNGMKQESSAETLESTHSYLRKITCILCQLFGNMKHICMGIQACHCSDQHIAPRTFAGHSHLCSTCVCRGKMQTLIKLEQRREQGSQLPRSRYWCPGNDLKNLHQSWKDLEDKRNWNLKLLYIA